MTLLFLTSWMLRATHGLFSHHGRHDRQVCEAPYEGNTKHIHDERFGVQDPCPLCTYLFSIPELISITATLAPDVRVWADSVVLRRESPCVQSLYDSCQRRGPPVL